MLSFALYLTYISLSYIRIFDAFFPDSESMRPMMVLGLLALATALARRASGNESAARNEQLVLIFGLLAWVGLSVAATGWVSGAVAAVNKFSTPVLMFILTTLNVTTKRRFTVAVATVVLSTVIIACAGISAYHYGFMRQQLILEQGEADESNFDDPNARVVLLRVQSLGFLNDPNDFAQAMVMVLPMLVAFLKKGRPLRNAFLFALPFSILVYTIYLTHSRGAIVGALAMLCLGARRSLGSVGTAVVVGMLLAGAVATDMSGGRDFSSNEESAGDRVDAWREGVMMLRSNPVSGIGFGFFTDHHTLTAHNSFVLCFAELGLVGFFMWLGLITSVFTSLRPLATAEHKAVSDFGWRWATAMRAALIGFLTCGWFLSRTYIDTLYLLLGLGAAVWHFETLTTAAVAPPWAGRAALSVCAVLATVYVMILAKGGF